MNPAFPCNPAAAEAEDDLRAGVASLAARVEVLEAALAAMGRPGAAPAAEGVPEALLPVLVAAAAAYLGVRPVLRQVRLVESAAWTQAGRAGLQGSHALPPHQRAGV
jgi:hypothetical protein